MSSTTTFTIKTKIQYEISEEKDENGKLIAKTLTITDPEADLAKTKVKKSTTMTTATTTDGVTGMGTDTIRFALSEKVKSFLVVLYDTIGNLRNFKISLPKLAE